jgi:hypothetical protein
VFLAYGAAELPDGELAQLAPETVTDHQALRRELEAIRERGYGTIVDELEPGLSAVAAPVRDRGGAVVAALSASGASLRLVRQRLRLLGRVTLEQAHAISTPASVTTVRSTTIWGCGPAPSRTSDLIRSDLGQSTERISRSKVSMCSARIWRARGASPQAIARSRSSCSCTRANRCGRRSSTRYQIRSERLK